MKLRILAAGFTDARQSKRDREYRYHIWLRNQNYVNVTNLVMLDDA